MSNDFSKFKILTCQTNPNIINNAKINYLLQTKQNSRGSLKFNFNNYKLSQNKNKNKNLRKSALLASNNPSTVETSISNSIFDGTINLKKQKYYSSKYMKNDEQTEKERPSVYYVPKNIEFKLIFDIIFGHFYYLSKNKRDITKIEKFVLELQKKFNKKVIKLYAKNIFDINNNDDKSELSNSLKIIQKEPSINTNKYFEIKDKIQFFYKLEDLMAIYNIIIFYLLKNHNKSKAKIIYLIMINQNLKCINYLENLINFRVLISEKNNKNLLRLYQIAIKIQLRIYSFLIKYGYFLHISYYGNLFMKKYFNISYMFYLFLMNIHRAKNSIIENENPVKHWFCHLNYYASYYSLANYLPLKIPIVLCNMILNIYHNIDDKYYELIDKNLILCTLYNKSILLYVNGQSDEAIISLKELKKKAFTFIDDNFIKGDKVHLLRNISHNSIAIESKKKPENKGKNKGKGIYSFERFFKAINKNKILNKSSSNTNILFTNYKKSLVNINKKFEPFFLSNSPFNIANFIKIYLSFYNIKVEDIDEKINPKATFNKKIKQCNSTDRRSFLQLTDFDKRKQRKLPNIFKSPFLIRTELLLGEIELDRKNYRAAYAYINHSLAIITVFRAIKNINYLNKYKNEQKLIKEFLNIIDYSNIKNDSILSEKQEEFSEEDDDFSFSKNNEFEKEFELKEKIKKNKKMLKEFQKFFVFFTTLSAYQIKVLNDTQPSNAKRISLPILFQNQFKDCLTVKQKLALENLHVMSLNRYMILKDPNRLILPNNLNINPLYFEKPELFSQRFFSLQKISKNIKMIEKKEKEKEIAQKEAHQIFLRILKSTNSKIYLQNFLNSNYNLVIKIIEKSAKNEINKMLENPSILIQPIEKFKLKNPNREKKKTRHKSQIFSSNKKILNKRISLIKENDIRMTVNNKNNLVNKLSKKNLKFSKSDKFYNIVNDYNINGSNTTINDKYIENKFKKKLFINNNSKNDNNCDSYSSLNISIG